MEHQGTSEIAHDYSPRFIVYKDGRVKRLGECNVVPPSFDPNTKVDSKDVIISPEVSARIYLPETENVPENTKLPLLIYFHGGAFCRYSAFSSVYHDYLNSLVSQAKVVAVSVDYRLAPEYPIPACYDDSWAAVQWAVSHSTGSGPDPWLNQWADFNRVVVAGDSAGANISHDVMVRAGPSGLMGPEARLVGCALIHSYFGGDEERLDLWDFLCEGKIGETDPRLNPAADPARMRREIGKEVRVLVCVDEKDWLRQCGVKYHEALKKSEWEGELEMVETHVGGHVCHIFKPAHHDACETNKFMSLFCEFINKN